MKDREKLNSERYNIVIVHYSCSSIDDKYPMVTSISTYDTKLNLPKTFSRENNSERDEINILEEFLGYISKKVESGSIILGWNWIDNYGIKGLISRYKQITGKNPKVKLAEIKTVDLLKGLTGNSSNFVGNMEFLAKYNGFNTDNFIRGIDEIKLFDDERFEKLNKSTMAKVGIIFNLLRSFVDNNIRIPSMEDFYYRGLDPYDAFKENIYKLKELIDIKNFNIQDETLETYLRNMFYANAITVLETYLSDAFITTVIKDRKLLKRYIEKSSCFNDTLTKRKLYDDMFGSETTSDDYVKNKCYEDIKNITFHNMKKASKVYNDVLGIAFPTDLNEIHKGIRIRHDLIHRNGKDKNDNIIKTDLTQLRTLITNVEKLVDYINKKIVSKKA